LSDYDVIIIGTGAGGGTLARHLAPSGKKILLLERGGWLAREPQNWSTADVFVDGRYISPDTWYDAKGKTFQPQVHYFVGGATKLYGAALYRLREKDFLNSIGVKTASYRAVRDLDSLRAALRELGTPSILKTVEFGYDGKGQFKFAAAGENIDDQAEEAWNALGRQAAILEGFVTFDKEVSVVAARGQNGAYHPFAVFENEHREQILDLTTWPADVSAIAARRAFDMAAAIGRELNIVGVYCVEYFVHGNTVIANEIAPRPHNSGHLTIDAADVSQFEQQLRAVCGLPLHTPVRTCGAAAMAQLLGDLWQDGEPAWDKAITGPNVHLHLYGKKDAKAKRKMGHLTATADTVAEARRNVENARKALSGPSPSGRG